MEDTLTTRPEEAYAAQLRIHAQQIRQLADQLDIQAHDAEQTPGGLLRIDAAAHRTFDVLDRLAEIPPAATRAIGELTRWEQPCPEQPIQFEGRTSA